MDEAATAGKAVHIHSYIMRLPQGCQTVIREDGGNISEGQKGFYYRLYAAQFE